MTPPASTEMPYFSATALPRRSCHSRCSCTRRSAVNQRACSHTRARLQVQVTVQYDIGSVSFAVHGTLGTLESTRNYSRAKHLPVQYRQ